MSAARKPTRQGILEMLRRCCIVLLCLALWAAAIGRVCLPWLWGDDA